MLSQLRFHFSRLALPLAASAAVAACSSAPPPKLQQEMFDTGASPFSRSFRATSNDACEAARRALLSQGYLTTTSTRSDTIDASKDFQPSSDKHIGVEFHVVCTPGEDADNSSIVYANAVQSGYTLKKSDTSASVGLSILGSLSLPIRSNSDAMVKVSSETIQSGAFYDRFFDYVDQYLRTVVKGRAGTGHAAHQVERDPGVAGRGAGLAGNSGRRPGHRHRVAAGRRAAPLSTRREQAAGPAAHGRNIVRTAASRPAWRQESRGGNRPECARAHRHCRPRSAARPLASCSTSAPTRSRRGTPRADHRW